MEGPPVERVPKDDGSRSMAVAEVLLAGGGRPTVIYAFEIFCEGFLSKDKDVVNLLVCLLVSLSGC